MAQKEKENAADQMLDGEDKSVEIQDLPITVHLQYIKDLSFENPGTPNVLVGLEDKNHSIKIHVDIMANNIEVEDKKDINNLYEVVLRTHVLAEVGNNPVFMVELDYGMLVSIGEGVSENMHHPILFIQIPQLLFPFSRNIISSMTADGGFPPVRLTPINFEALYRERFKEELEASQREAEAQGK
ncbi:MAG: protein-export chaperone SecB [Alphaproteobacteria bacterium]